MDQRESLVEEVMGAASVLNDDLKDNSNEIIQDMIDLDQAERELYAWETAQEE